MKEILLVEDRMDRKRQYCAKKVDNYEDYFEICTGANFDELKNLLKISNFSKFDKYKYLIFHASSLSADEKNSIKQYCKDKKKPLIFFSGNVSKASYRNQDFPFLIINALQFYREGLLFFLENYDSNDISLLMLQYGKRWKLNLLIEYRNTLNLKVEQAKPDGTISFRKVEISDIIVRELNIIFKTGIDRVSFDINEQKELSEKLDKLIIAMIG